MDNVTSNSVAASGANGHAVGKAAAQPTDGVASNVVALPRRPRPGRVVRKIGSWELTEAKLEAEGERLAREAAENRALDAEDRALCAEAVAERRVEAEIAGIRKLVATASAAPVLVSSDEGAALTPALFDAWLSSIDGTTDARTRKEYGRIARVQWMPLFKTHDALDGAKGTRNAKAYTNTRLKCVSRTMHKKELSALRGFVAWLAEHEYIADVPHVPPPPKKATGKRSATARPAPVSCTEAEMESIIARLPEWSPRARRGSERHRVRDVFVLAWETGLRPISIARLRAPTHWRPGMRALNITAEIDKARFARELPLTLRAVEVLERCAPKEGLVFGRHDYRTWLKRAALEVLGEERGKHFARYDFRHNRADFLLDVTGDLRGVAFNHGHKLLSTTDKYLRPSRKGAEAMLAKVAARSGASGGSGAASVQAEGVLDELQAGEYTSVSSRTWRNWQTHQIQVLAR